MQHFSMGERNLGREDRRSGEEGGRREQRGGGREGGREEGTGGGGSVCPVLVNAMEEESRLAHPSDDGLFPRSLLDVAYLNPC